MTNAQKNEESQPNMFLETQRSRTDLGPASLEMKEVIKEHISLGFRLINDNRVDQHITEIGKKRFRQTLLDAKDVMFQHNHDLHRSTGIDLLERLGPAVAAMSCGSDEQTKQEVSAAKHRAHDLLFTPDRKNLLSILPTNKPTP